MDSISKVRLSIIIVSFNTKEITANCIKSIYNAKWRSEYEVILVDNNSQDGSVENIRQNFPDVKVIANSDNKLFSIANNQGAAIARGEYLLLLNSDTIVDSDNLQKMIDFYETCDSRVVCIGPKILNPDGSLQSCGFPQWGGSIMNHVLNLFRVNRFLPVHWLFPTLEYNPNKTHQVGWVSGSCMMIRRELYNKLGGLNENLVFYGEEPEFGYRTKKLGYKTIYFPEATIIHLGGASTDKEQVLSFEKDIAQYDSLVSETIGYKKAIAITKWTRLALRIKSLLNPKNDYVKSRIDHEGKVADYFRNKLKK